MKRSITIVILLLALSVVSFAQKAPVKPRTPAQEYVLKKQIFVDDVESGLGSVPYAAVRVRVRYELAAWLWKKGPDDTGHAETLAVKAVEELYEKIGEIENPEWTRSDLFTLLEKNAKATAIKLKAKYFTSPENDLENAADIVNEPGGDKEVARRLIKAINAGGDFGWRISSLLRELSDINSPELGPVLTVLIAAGRTGKMQLDNVTLAFILDTISAGVTDAVRKDLFLLILNRAGEAMRDPGGNNDRLFYLLRDTVRKLGSSAPELIPEAEAIEGMLGASANRASAAMKEINDRIAASEDKLAATMEEAANAPTLDTRTKLYIRAEELALEQDRFAIAIEAIETLREINKGNSETFFTIYPDQEMAIIARKALSKSAEAPARKAIEKIGDDIKRADVLKDAAIFYYDRKNTLESEDLLNKCFKLLADADREKPARVHTLLRLVPAVSKIAGPRLREVIVLTAKAINDLPTPGPDDKPGTENFKKFITTAVALIYNMKPAMQDLLKSDITDAEEFAGRLQKRESRIMADMMIGIEKLETLQKPARK